MERIHAARSQAGEWLNRADNITSSQADRTLTAEAEQSRAVELDMAKDLSDLNKAQTGCRAALQPYAQIQRLSLFDCIS